MNPPISPSPRGDGSSDEIVKVVEQREVGLMSHLPYGDTVCTVQSLSLFLLCYLYKSRESY